MQIQQATKYDITHARRVAVAVQEVFGVQMGEFLGPKREHRLQASKRCFYIVMRDLGYSLVQIAEYAGRIDHTSIIYALNKGALAYATKEDYRHKVNRVRIAMNVSEGADMADRVSKLLHTEWDALKDKMPMTKLVEDLVEKEEHAETQGPARRRQRG